MSHKTRQLFTLLCVLLVALGVIAWRGYSRRALELAVYSATQPKDVDALIRAVASDDAGLRQHAAQCIARMGVEAKAALPALMEALLTQDNSYTYSTHTQIILAIGSIGTEAEPAVPLLIELLNHHDDPGVTDFRGDAAVKALGQIGAAAADAIPALLNRLKGQSFTERDATVTSLARIGPNSPDVVAALMAIVEDSIIGPNPVVAALAQMGTPATEAVNAYIDELLGQVANGDGLVRLREAGGATFFVPIATQSKLESLGPLAMPRLRTGLRDDSEPVRVISAYVLANQGKSDDEVVQVLTAALDRSPYRSGAKSVLSKLLPNAQDSPATKNSGASVDSVERD